MHLILLRHTRPMLSSDICYGNLDIDLIADYAADFEQTLAGLPSFDRIISSPLRRCRLLAAHIAGQTGRALVFEPDLTEMDFGAWQGRPWDDIAIAEIDEWAADFEHGRPHGGESVAQLRARLQSMLQRFLLAQVSVDERVLVVTHAGVIRALAAMVAGDCNGGDERNIQIGYGEIIALNTSDLQVL